MRDYQPKKDKRFFLPPSIYRRTLALVRDYDRMIAEKNDILYSTHHATPGGSSGSVGRPTESKAMQLAEASKDCDVVRAAIDHIPPEYRRGVLDNVRYGIHPISPPANKNTWSYWRVRFLYYIAEQKNWI